MSPASTTFKKEHYIFWNNELETHFHHIKNKVVNSTENKPYNPHFANSIKCDAAGAGLDAFIYWKSFAVITDHGALLSILKDYWSNKSYNSRHTRWVDRLLPFDFNFESITDAKRGLVD